MIQKLRIMVPWLAIAVILCGLVAISPTGVNAACDPSTTASSGNDCVHQAIDAANGGEGTNTEAQISLGAGFGFGSIGQALNTIISVIFLIAGLAAFVYILLGAFNYLTAGDDTGKTDKARKMITNAVVGLILVALVYVIWLVAINLIPGLSDFFTTTNSADGT